MSNEKKNLLIGAFRAPPVGTPPSITQHTKQPETPKDVKVPAASPTAPVSTKPEESKKTVEPAKDDKAVKDGKPAAAAPAPTKPEESKKPAEPAKVDEVKKPVGQETSTASATRTADGPKGSAVTKVFEDRLDAPTEADLFKLPTPSEGEIYSMAVHPAYLKDFLDHPFTVNRDTQDYKDLFESIKNYGMVYLQRPL